LLQSRRILQPRYPPAYLTSRRLSERWALAMSN
jgi:hypothetical protein